MNLKEIKSILGGDISTKNTKMPGTSFGLSTDYCNVGGTLRGLPGSVCEKCYAARLESFRPTVKQGWTSRAKAVHRATVEELGGMDIWVQAMVERLTKLAPEHHRWHDSGDLLNYRHLLMIVAVAKQMPEIKFWLPTKEKQLVMRYQSCKVWPDNLTVRLSAPMVGGIIERDDIPTSMVFDAKNDDPSDLAWICPARHQGNACGDCRACWDRDVQVVAYPKH